MKQIRLLCPTCVFALVLCTVSTSVATTGAVSISETTPNISDEMEYYPFVYSEDETFAWARELIGDCSVCEAGYLYVQDLSSHEIWQVIDQPVDFLDHLKKYYIVW